MGEVLDALSGYVGGLCAPVALDNSTYNTGATDPTVAAYGGQQTWEEMFIGFIGLQVSLQ